MLKIKNEIDFHSKSYGNTILIIGDFTNDIAYANIILIGDFDAEIFYENVGLIGDFNTEIF